MDYEAVQPWAVYTYEVQESSYEVFEGVLEPEEYVDYGREAAYKPTLNLQADESTLNCLKWLLVDQKDVDLELKTAPQMENFEYASSDEDIWDALSAGKEKRQSMSRKPKIEINTTCEWRRCNAQFTNNKDYRSHISKHFQEFVNLDYDEYLCEWDLCGFKTTCKVIFERHVLHHEMHGRFLSAGESLEIKNKVPKCTLGGFDRNRLPELLTDFTCLWKDCTETFRALSLLHDHLMHHIEAIYVSQKPNTCQWRGCSYVNNSLCQLKNHASRMHAQILFYACRKCGTTRKSNVTFLAHFLSQAPVKNPDLCCPHCNQLFLKDVHLRGHMKNRHQAVVCNICHLNFMGETQLKVHVANVHVKLRPFKCPDCPKAFPSKNNLRAHMHVHDKKEGGFQCPTCNYRGSSYLALRKHNYASHMGRNYPYECHLCGIQFRDAPKLSRHLKKVHNVGVPEGFHRYTYRLEEGLVFHLKTQKTYEPNQKGLDIPQSQRIQMSTEEPIKLEMKMEVKNDSTVIKVQLKTECVEPPNVDPGKRILTRSRAARKLLAGQDS